MCSICIHVAAVAVFPQGLFLDELCVDRPEVRPQGNFLKLSITLRDMSQKEVGTVLNAL
jgi:hypothetical protein